MLQFLGLKEKKIASNKVVKVKKTKKNIAKQHEKQVTTKQPAANLKLKGKIDKLVRHQEPFLKKLSPVKPEAATIAKKVNRLKGICVILCYKHYEINLKNFLSLILA